MDHQSDILVVDDTPQNLKLLNEILRGDGYKVRPAPNGEVALRAVEASVPDLILLDINMPVMDGYETCAALKADPRFADVPVIFLSALSETADKVKAFETGGVDYVTKPFQAQEVLARVRTHLGIARLKAELEARYADLQELEKLRDTLTHMIVHDLRSPLSGVSTSLQLLERAPELSEESREDVAVALGGAKAVERMVTALLDVNKMESGEMPVNRERLDIAEAATDAVTSLGGLASSRVTVSGSASGEFDPGLITRLVANLLGNALRYSPEDASVEVRISGTDPVRIEVADQGPGIPEAYREKIFEKFGRIEARHAGTKLASTGLGLTFCKLAAEAHGGTIGVDSVEGEGSTFWIELPATGR